MFPKVALSLLYNIWTIKETRWKQQLSFILMSFHSRSPTTDCRNGDSTFKLRENSFFDFYNSIHVVRNNCQISCQSVENQGSNMKNTVFFILMIFHLSSPKTDAEMKTSHPKLWECSLFDFLIYQKSRKHYEYHCLDSDFKYKKIIKNLPTFFLKACSRVKNHIFSSSMNILEIIFIIWNLVNENLMNWSAYNLNAICMPVLQHPILPK